MRIFFDTSVLVAAVKKEHPHHVASLRALNDAGVRDAATAAHCLAEFYATVTGYPGQHRIPLRDARVILAGFREILSVITLEEEDYYETFDGAARESLIGAVIYDALIARCALKWRAQRLYTWNTGDYQRLGVGVSRISREPA